MESAQNDLETSWNIIKVPLDPQFSNTSDINMLFGSDTSGATDIKKSITENIFSSSSFKPFEESEFFRNEIVNKHTLTYHQKRLSEMRPFESPTKEVISTRLSLKFNEKVEDLMNLDSNFRKFISQIEIGLNAFIKIKHMSISSTIFFEIDWEIPDYEKLVLFLNFEGIPFTEELKLWKKISSLIYERIKSLITISTEEDIKIIKEWKKNFFIKVDMY